MTTTQELQNMEGQTAVDLNGAKLGKIGQIYVDDQSGQPLWITITTGMFGTKQSFAPLYGSRSDGGNLQLAVMTRSEEQLHVGTEKVEAGRARLRKYVVTENVTQTVPVSHEEVRLEREPVTDANRGAATSGSDISEEEHEVTLRAERPVVNKETVPVERVRLGTETVTEDHEVSETVRKEQIDNPDVDTTGTTR